MYRPVFVTLKLCTESAVLTPGMAPSSTEAICPAPEGVGVGDGVGFALGAGVGLGVGVGVGRTTAPPPALPPPSLPPQAVRSAISALLVASRRIARL
ncbi:hypothetical protein FHS91_003207 [Sphingobium xanthum]|uniref:hypothetical protein n=1 Tax=Sphingobium xanthum TaxID=1387165 RepID=UPI001C8B2A72|nr:hypothetical protein [Sphingobium xanthum]